MVGGLTLSKPLGCNVFVLAWRKKVGDEVKVAAEHGGDSLWRKARPVI
jgi:hypothetical protein